MSSTWNSPPAWRSSSTRSRRASSPGRRCSSDFYCGASIRRCIDRAQEAPTDTRLKVPDEVTDENCELCGRNMVVKTGRFGKFLACPGYPECKNTKPIVERMPGRCPKCGSTILKRKSKQRLRLLCL